MDSVNHDVIRILTWTFGWQNS